MRCRAEAIETPMNHAYAYLRVSHRDSAASGISPDLQLDTFKKWFEFEKSTGRMPGHELGTIGWHGGPDVDEDGIVRRDAQGIYKRLDADRNDGVFMDLSLSAYKRKFLQRPAGVRLNMNLKPGDIVWFFNVNRAFRRASDTATMMEAWLDRDIQMVFHGSNLDTRTAMGRAMVQMAGVFAELDSAMKSEHQMEIKASLSADGIPTNGNRQLGFKRHGNRWVPDLEEREVMKAIVAIRHHRHPKPTSWAEVSDLIESELARKEGRQKRGLAGEPPRFWNHVRCRDGYRIAIRREWATLPPGIDGDYVHQWKTREAIRQRRD